MKYNHIGEYKYKDLERFTYAQLEAEEIAKRRHYVIAYDPFETDFEHLGEAILNDCIADDIIIREINGDYSFSCKVFKDGRGKYKRIKPLTIIKAQNQLFRIPIFEGIKDNGLNITIQAKHIFWDLQSAFTEIRGVNNQNIYEAASRLLEADYTNRFRLGVTDVTTVANAKFDDENAVEGIMKKLLPRWEAEIFLDNFKITFKKRIGKYKPDLYIRFGKNASKIRKKVDCSNLCTRIYAKGANGIDLKESTGGLRYIDSPKINKYPLIYPKSVKFDSEDVAILLEDSKKYIKENDTPLESIELELIDLLENKEYENLFNAVNIELGDTVTVYDLDLNVNEEIRCIKEEIIARTGIKKTIILGKFIPSLTDSINDTEHKIDDVDNKVDNVAQSEGNSNMEIEALKKNIELIGAEINELEKTDASLSKRIQTLETKENAIIDSVDIDITENRQLVVLPEKFRSKNIKVLSISLLKAENITNIEIKEMDHSLINNTIYLVSNVVNITARMMIISI